MKKGDMILVYNEPDSTCVFIREFLRLEDGKYICKALDGNKKVLKEIRWSYLYEVKK